MPPSTRYRTAEDLAADVGWTTVRVSGRLYKARLRYAETGQWDAAFIPEPANEAQVRAGAKEPPAWDEEDPAVTGWVAVNRVPDAAWWDTRDFASHLWPHRTPDRWPDLLRRARYATRQGTLVGARAIPDPGIPASGRQPALWDSSRPDVQACVTAYTVLPEVKLLDHRWLLSQYLPPPDGAGRTVQQIARAIGLPRGSRKYVREALVAAGATIRSTRVKATPVKPVATSKQLARAERLDAARRGQAETAAAILASGMHLSPLQRRALEGRVAHPALTAEALAGVVGVPRGSLSATWTKVMQLWVARGGK